MKRTALILAGGGGSRLWPLSRESEPKQFTGLGGKTSFSFAWENASLIARPENIYVATLGKYHKFVLSQSGVAKENIITEPVRRNTAPCVAAALAEIARREGDATVAVMPSDHFISGPFAEDAAKACELAEATGSIVLFGVVPTRPETTFGYIRSDGEPGAAVTEFIEKPSGDTARALIEQGCLWNSGIYVGRISSFTAQFEKYLPQLYDFIRRGAHAEEYAALEPVSIDKGVTEKSSGFRVLKASFMWEDVGSFPAVERGLPKDENGNFLSGRVFAPGCSDSLVISSSGVTAVSGLKDIAVVNTGDVCIVYRRDDAEAIGRIRELLRQNGLETLL